MIDHSPRVISPVLPLFAALNPFDSSQGHVSVAQIKSTETLGNTDDANFAGAQDFERQNDFESQSEFDTLIEQAIRDRWQKEGLKRFKNLQVDVENGMVRLSGTLNSYYHKQLAHSLIRMIHGIRQIDNDIQVLHSR